MADGTGLQGLLQSAQQGLQNYGRKFSNFWLGGSPAQAIPAPSPNTKVAPPQQPQLPEQPPLQMIEGFRFNETDPKAGPVEVLPTKYPMEHMLPYLEAYKVATKQYGMPKLSPEKLAAMALAEGRYDFGYNQYNTENKEAQKLYETMTAQGIPPRAAGFAAAILDKQQVAKRLKIPFEKAWNGTGRSAAGKTGNDYVRRVRNNLKAVNHEKNKKLYEFIKSNTALADDQYDDVETAAKGGHIGKPLPGGSKMI